MEEEEDENNMEAYYASQAQISQNPVLAIAYQDNIASYSFLNEEDIHTLDEEDIRTWDEVADIHNILAASLKG